MPKMTCEMLMWFLAISIIVLFRYNGTFRLCGGGGGGGGGVWQINEIRYSKRGKEQ